jgi:hypothetical protein
MTTAPPRATCAACTTGITEMSAVIPTKLRPFVSSEVETRQRPATRLSTSLEATGSLL